MQPWKAYGRDEPFHHAYIGGTFDCLHRGHLALFGNAKKIAKHLTVSVNSDEFAERYKRRPLMPLADRMAVLMQCRLVDHVILNEGNEDSRDAIIAASMLQYTPVGIVMGPARPRKIDVIVHGDDWTGESYLAQLGVTQEWLDDRTIQVVYMPYSNIVNTTQLQHAWMMAQFPNRSCPQCQSILVSESATLHRYCVKCGAEWGEDKFTK